MSNLVLLNLLPSHSERWQDISLSRGKQQGKKTTKKNVLLQGKAQMVPTSVDVKLFNCGLTYCF